MEIWKKRGKINGSVRAEVGDETYLIYTNSLNKYGIRVYTLLPESYYTKRIGQEIVILLVQSVFTDFHEHIDYVVFRNSFIVL